MRIRYLLVPSEGRLLGSGVNKAVSTAFGITETFSFGMRARSTVFSLPVHMRNIRH